MIEYGNAWGGAPRIWDALFDRYIKDPNVPYDYIFSDSNSKKLWALADRKDLSDAERASLLFTFDHAYVCKSEFKALSQHLREFNSMYPVDGRSNHLPAWVDFLDSCEADAVGLWATSVSENPWATWNSETEESDPKPLSEGWSIYENLETAPV